MTVLGGKRFWAKPIRPVRRSERICSCSSGSNPLAAKIDFRLLVGTGSYGSLPLAPDLLDEAARRGVEIIALPTPEVLSLIEGLDAHDVFAVVHVTC